MSEWQQLLGEILACDVNALPPESTPLRDTKGWDSLRHVLLVVGLEKQLSTRLTAEEIQGMVTLGDVARLAEQKAADA